MVGSPEALMTSENRDLLDLGPTATQGKCICIFGPGLARKAIFDGYFKFFSIYFKFSREPCLEKKNKYLFHHPLNRTEKGTVAKIKSRIHPLCTYHFELIGKWPVEVTWLSWRRKRKDPGNEVVMLFLCWWPNARVLTTHLRTRNITCNFKWWGTRRQFKLFHTLKS